MNIKKINALFGKYPSCDMLNNALRFLRVGNTDCAIEEIIFAIEKADGYFHEDNLTMVEDAKRRWMEKHTHEDKAENINPCMGCHTDCPCMDAQNKRSIRQADRRSNSGKEQINVATVPVQGCNADAESAYEMVSLLGVSGSARPCEHQGA